MASLEILNVLNNFDIKSMGEGTADYYHALIEATKEAFVDRDKYLSDPDFVKIPLDYLLSAKHGKDQAARNLSLLRKITLAMLRLDTAYPKSSLRQRRNRASRKPLYRAELLGLRQRTKADVGESTA